MTATTFASGPPSPAASINAFDISMSPMPEGTLSNENRVQLQQELEQIRSMMAESQASYNVVYVRIPKLQQLVLSTHAQVAAAKQALLEAKGTLLSALSSPSSSLSSSPSSSNNSSATNSNSSSPPSPFSPLNHVMQDKEHEQKVRRLEEEHMQLGINLSNILRKKAEAEANKKKLSDYLMQAKQRIKDIEQKLRE
ncbi:hypothetical protein BGZ65_010228 [Modicella reniformis]|uniref:Uncharacterized protein n=1 Tax=Modicella reniformis TaxID=1440133 RepID=A0A9P6MDN2_9FUNG|nr:hypothetical protein BGZ65_010228 [Modicella reniformis]